MGSGNDPDVDLDGGVGSDRADFAFLEDAEQGDLRFLGKLSDLVEEERAAVGRGAPAPRASRWRRRTRRACDRTAPCGPRRMARRMPAVPRPATGCYIDGAAYRDG